MTRLNFGKAFIILGLTSLVSVSPLIMNKVLAEAEAELPGGRSTGAGSRSGTECFLGDKHLTALIPKTYLGKTASERPTFYFYVPQSVQGKMIEFVLRDAQDQLVYEQIITVSHHSGIIGINLADSPNAVSLMANQQYSWYFSIICNAEQREYDLVVQGGVERVNSSLETIQSQKLWYDNLHTLAELRRHNPQDMGIEQQWTHLLGSVDLDNLAQEPLLESETHFQAMTTE